MSDDYTIADHEFRDDDVYALGKYQLTSRWLRSIDTRGTLFNIGCGAGQFNTMAADLGFTVRGFEPDPQAFALADANRPPGRCDVEQLSVEQIEGEHVADVIVMHDVLEHIEDEAATVARIRRLLKPDGVLVISVPALPSLFGYHDEQLGHFRRYTRRTLTAALQTSFQIVHLRYYGASLIPVTLWFSRIRRKPYPTADVAAGGITGKALEIVCRAEQRLPGPVGTSLVCMARPRPH
jgi:2-polyprenyl-3-methyl-5-hydroxy-6-metoxy-1,4-benzoquinol methylase